jgi:hypothetical protein
VPHQPFRHDFLPNFEFFNLTSESVGSCQLPVKEVLRPVRIWRPFHISNLRQALICGMTARILHHIFQPVPTTRAIAADDEPSSTRGLREKFQFRDCRRPIQPRYRDPNLTPASFVLSARRRFVPTPGIEAFTLTNAVRKTADGPERN